MKATVFGVFEDLKFKISEGSDLGKAWSLKNPVSPNVYVYCAWLPKRLTSGKLSTQWGIMDSEGAFLFPFIYLHYREILFSDNVIFN